MLQKNVWIGNDSRGLPERIESKKIYVDGKGRLRTLVAGRKMPDWVFELRKWIAQHSYVFLLLSSRMLSLKGIHTTEGSIYYEEKEDEWSRLAQIIKGWKNLVEKQGKTFVILVVPHYLQLDDKQWALFVEQNKGIAGIDRRRPQKMLAKIAQVSGIPVVDLLTNHSIADYDSGMRLRIDGHPNSKGYGFFADYATPDLLKIIENERHIKIISSKPVQ